MFKMNNRKSITGLAVAVLLGLDGAALAATDGDVSDLESVGSAEISVTIPPLVKVSGMTDIALGTSGTWYGTGPATGSTDATICVYHNNGAAYTAIFTGNGGVGAAFTIANAGNTIPYTVTYNDGVGGGGAATTGVGLACGNASLTSLTCSDMLNKGTISISIAEADMALKGPALYSGILTMTVAAQ